MSRDCRAEECPMWDGDTCPCETFGLDPDNPPTSGIYSTAVEFSESCCGKCPGDTCYVDGVLDS